MTETADIAAQDMAPGTDRASMTWRPVLVVAAVVAAIHLTVATRFGWYGDEFYYVICGRHPAWGYVDQPPLTPILARLAAALPGDGGLLPLRLLAIATQVGCVVLGAMLAAELGGRRRAQIISAAALGASPVFVAGSLLFGTTVTDQFFWAALFVLVARALRLSTWRAWLAAGIVAGLGLENKDTVFVLLAGIAVGLALFRRPASRTLGPWLAGGVALVIAVPNLVWDALNHWPNLQMDRVVSSNEGGALGSLKQVPLLAILYAGPLLISLWIMGLRWLGSAAGREHRWVLAVAVVAIVGFTAGGGKPYYAAPALAGLFAAGAVRIEAAATARGRYVWPVVLTASGVMAVLLSLPVLPLSAANALRPINPDLMETYGWPQFVNQVVQAEAQQPAGTPIFTSNYEEAGALTILGPAAGLRQPVYSAFNNYYEWGPPPGESETVLCVGGFDTAYLHRFWSKVREIAPITLPDGLKTNEVVDGNVIYLCQDPHGSWAQLWPGLRNID